MELERQNTKKKLQQDFQNITYEKDKAKVGPNGNILMFLLAVTIAIFPIGALVGSLLIGLLVDRFGRKRTLLINDLLAIFSAICLGCSDVVNSHGFTIFARFGTGMCSGIFDGVVPMYLGEISPVNWRGCINILSMLFVLIGLMVNMICGHPQLLWLKKGKPIVMSFTAFVALLQLLLLLPFPESPRYLLIQKKNEEEARQALKKLRDQDDVEEEMEEIRQEYHYEREEKQINVSKLLCFKSLRRQLLCIVILKAGQELSGINAAYFYMREIFLSTGAGEHNSWYSHFSTACFLIFSQAFAMYVIDSWGRRFLLLVGFGSCSILCILLTMTIQLKDTISWMPYINMCFGILLVGAHMFGPNLVPNLMITELFLQSSRSSAYAIGGCVRWFFNFLNGFTILHVYNQIGTYIFLVYFPFSAGCFLYILKFVPETKKKTFLEIRRLMEMHIAKEKLVKAAVQ
ncbi:solute carrier family 2, facilitated glucose transporter member 5-like isoform X2 [Hemicordylus capensis]|uniref:solute carrier family 2, facilitated glucose transporter member 5-like isoform X2 n=1 Tax=Hemicordylus capensis TaxID=884348 RepID=UPI0023030624|nr:solute carrier family 2, facilitated glucose transporter member 5-like isoform X2 [Hemicordylus capensis]